MYVLHQKQTEMNNLLENILTQILQYSGLSSKGVRTLLNLDRDDLEKAKQTIKQIREGYSDVIR